MADATVKGGFFEANGVGTLSQYGGGAGRRVVAQQMTDKSLASLREREATLNGVAPGSAAVALRSEIAASEELGGKRVVTVTEVVNRSTTAADVTEIKTGLLDPLSGRTSFGSNPPVNKDENPLGTR